MGEMDDIIKEFLVESLENLDQMDRDLVALEEKPDSLELLANIFRTIHTIKGSCGFFAFEKLEAITHQGEDLLHMMREGKLRLNSEITSGLLALVDAVRKILAEIEKSGGEGDGDYTKVAENLKSLKTQTKSQPEPKKQASLPAASKESPQTPLSLF